MLIPALLLFALQTATDTPPPPPAPPPPAQPVNPDSQRRICRTMQVTGSRLGSRRICRTAEEWRRADQTINDDMRDQRNSVPSPVTSELTPT